MWQANKPKKCPNSMSVRGHKWNCLPASAPPPSFEQATRPHELPRISLTMPLDFEWVLGFSFASIRNESYAKVVLKVECRYMVYTYICHIFSIYLIPHIKSFSLIHRQFPISPSLPANQAFLYPSAIVKLFRFAHPTAHLFPFTPTHTRARVWVPWGGLMTSTFSGAFNQ